MVQVSIGEDSQGEQPPQSPYTAALNSIRSAARWLFSIFTALGAALLTSVSFTRVGGLEVGGRFFVALGGIAIALIAIGVLIKAVIDILTNPYADFTTLTVEATVVGRYPEVKEAIEQRREEIYRDAAVDLHELFGRLKGDNEKLRSDAAEQADLPHIRRRRDAAARVVDFTNYELARSRLATLFWKLVLASVGAFAGIMVFVLATNLPSETDVSEPTAVTVTLDEDQRPRWEELLSPECDFRNVEAIAVGGTFDEPEVVVIPQDGCEAVRLTVARSDGVAVPAITAEEASK